MDVSLGSALHARSRLQEVCSPDRDDSVPARRRPGDARRRRRATTIRSPDRVRFGMVVDASAATRRGACMVDPLLAGDRAAAPRTLVDVLADVTARHPDAPALDDTVTVLTYAELTEQARRMAAELVAAGVCRGDRPLRRRGRSPPRRGGVRACRRRRPAGAGRPRLLRGRGEGGRGSASAGHGAVARLTGPGVRADRPTRGTAAGARGPGRSA